MAQLIPRPRVFLEGLELGAGEYPLEVDDIVVNLMQLSFEPLCTLIPDTVVLG